MIRKVLIGSVIAVAAVMLTGGQAFAFHCINASRSDNGNEHAAGSGALVSAEEFLGDPDIVGLCPAGVEHVISGLQDEGFDTDFLVNFHAVMAGGLEKNGKGEEILHDGQGIDHLTADFEATADELIGEGFGICAD